MAVAQSEQAEGVVKITAPEMAIGVFPIRFIDPYVSNAFSQDAEGAIKEKQDKGGSITRKKTVRKAKNFHRLYEQSMHTSEEGWRGIPAQAFHTAMVRACVLAGYEMTRAKMALKVLPDGFDKVTRQPLVRITKGQPEMFIAHAPNANGRMDLRSRAMWKECEVNLRVRWDTDQFGKDDVGNLILRAGLQVGVGAGRPFSEKSSGCGWGTFEFRD